MMMTQFEQDWEQFEELSPYLKSGEVLYRSDPALIFHEIVMRFPILAHRIDWSKIDHLSLLVPRSALDYEEAITQFLESILCSLQTADNEMLFAVFDGFTEGSLEISNEVLRKMAHTFFSIAQHTYVLPQDYKWCLQYSFEGYLYFGFASRDEGKLNSIFLHSKKAGFALEMVTSA
jgi:hypothetical protein